ncbi:phospholipid carrier-dependent glycosyltransferase [Trichothermofontia sichuanensis B231]|uniref:phospholipid carrier-dependent glycosyltransferase n=1 Tax=Trichothermofontia sichuanensis TaxID=3045816 RepID=UPI002246ADEB|nr:phospholipid carrier-dependent glycosyltransferase [Trichothermofontia sichuanensis]UZQ55883.1 phospholipid carrier-dependent glycosyltransferase [Trichothermofontia sichuanensis B231]
MSHATPLEVRSQRRCPDLTMTTFRWGLVAIWLFALALRFWGLSRFNTFVFDEVYYVKFANNYLTQTPFFDGHPPFAKYLIALGIWLGQHVPGNFPYNDLAGSWLSTWSYRWLNAVTGSLIPLLSAGVVYQLSHRRRIALLAAFLVAMDGLFLVESRYALVNVYLVLFGLGGQYAFLAAINSVAAGQSYSWRTLLWLLLAGISFAASFGIKWNGLGFWLGAWLLWGLAWVIRWLSPGRRPAASVSSGQYEAIAAPLLRRLNLQTPSYLPVWGVGLGLAIVPILVYGVIWLPHLHLNPDMGFWRLQQEILNYHQRVGGNTPQVHPYCSAWWTWPLLLRPMVYFFEAVPQATAQLPVYGPPLPAGTAQVVYDVHAIGNPILWWISGAAIGLLSLYLLYHLGQWLTAWVGTCHFEDPLLPKLTLPNPKAAPTLANFAPTPPTNFAPTPPNARGERTLVSFNWLATYCVLNYAANWLPWAKVSRCTFIYHHMGAALFGFLALAFVLDRWLQTKPVRPAQPRQPLLRPLAIGILWGIVLSFLFWLPLYLGWPLSPTARYLRLWLPGW